jgi:hypothetical protein
MSAPELIISFSEPCGELFAALAKAQAEMENAKKNADNPHFKKPYADFNSIRDEVIPHLSANGICAVQTPGTIGNQVSVTTLLGHSSGQWLRGVCSWAADKANLQGFGSAITYLRRYSLQSVVCLGQEDDDDGEKDRKAWEKKQNEHKGSASGAGDSKPRLDKTGQTEPAKEEEKLLINTDDPRWVKRLTTAFDQRGVDEHLRQGLLARLNGKEPISAELEAAIEAARAEFNQITPVMVSEDGQ